MSAGARIVNVEDGAVLSQWVALSSDARIASVDDGGVLSQWIVEVDGKIDERRR